MTRTAVLPKLLDPNLETKFIFFNLEKSIKFPKK